MARATSAVTAKLPARRFAALGVILALTACTHFGTTPPPNRRAVEHGLLPAIVLAGKRESGWSIEERMARYRVPGVSIAVINDGRIEWVAGYGVTRANGGEAVTGSTLFQAASISKLVTATAVLRLVQDGALDLDEDVNRRLRTWHLPPSDTSPGSAVTLRGLLSHSAGINVSGFAGYKAADVLPSLRQILEGEAPANSPAIRIVTRPGTIYRYSGGGYQIVQQLLEDATGFPFARVLEDRVLKPLAMTHSTFQFPLPEEQARHASFGHEYDGTPIENGGNTYPESAAAGLWATPLDLARLGVALSKASAGRSTGVLDAASVDLMLTRGAGDMGLGAGVHGQGGGLHFDHAGANRGFRAYLIVYPRTGQGVVVMSNGDGADDLVKEIVRGVAHAYDWPDFAPAQRTAVVIADTVLERHAGAFQVREYGFDITVTREADHLRVATPRGSWYSFYPAGDDEFFAIEDGSELAFSVDAASGESILRVWGMTARRR